MSDEIIEEVRRVRREQAAKWDFDLKAMLADARRRQEQCGHPVVSFVPKQGEKE